MMPCPVPYYDLQAILKDDNGNKSIHTLLCVSLSVDW